MPRVRKRKRSPKILRAINRLSRSHGHSETPHLAVPDPKSLTTPQRVIFSLLFYFTSQQLSIYFFDFSYQLIFFFFLRLVTILKNSLTTRLIFTYNFGLIFIYSILLRNRISILIFLIWPQNSRLSTLFDSNRNYFVVLFLLSRTLA